MSVFRTQLAEYQRLVSEDITIYATHIRKSAFTQYGARGEEITNLFLERLQAQTARTPGVLAIVAYEMLGGKDQQMITRAATALEMMHTHAHILEIVAKESNAEKRNGLLHAGVIGMHAAQMLFAGLNAEPELKVKVLGIVNLAMVVTGHGQATDQRDTLCVAEWKTANHVTLNPLCVGMVLAGADCHDTDAIRDYALNLGIALALGSTDAHTYAQLAKEVLTTAPLHWKGEQVSLLKEFAETSVNSKS